MVRWYLQECYYKKKSNPFALQSQTHVHSILKNQGIFHMNQSIVNLRINLVNSFRYLFWFDDYEVFRKSLKFVAFEMES